MSLTTTTETPRYQFDQATNTVLLGKTESGAICYTGRASKVSKAGEKRLRFIDFFYLIVGLGYWQCT